MALKSWASISTLADVIPFIRAEAAQAAKECPAAFQAYNNALANAKKFKASVDIETSQGVMPSAEYNYVQQVKAEVQEARNSWYASGCKAPSDQTPVGAGKTGAVAPPSIPDDSGGLWTEVQTFIETPAAEGGAIEAGMVDSNWVLWVLGGAVAFLVFKSIGGAKGGKGKSRAKAKKPAKKSRRR